MQTINLSNAEINTLQTDPNELPLDPHHEGVPSGVSKIIFRAYGTFYANRAPFLC
jgi:hypothetical protein